jgi:hypothetical protein
MSRSSLFAVLAFVSCSYALAGCAGMIAGSHDWFERKRPDVEPLASTDLACTGKPIEFVAAAMDDYREVEARGCAKKVRYKLVKVSFVEKWVKSSEVAPL